jgi:methylmalonyl-CoA mutase
MNQEQPYVPNHKIRIVTAASLFDGHDVAINLMRRILQSTGCEIIHLGHDRSVGEIVQCAIQEDAHAIAVSSYQGGHMEYFRYIKDLLEENQCGHIQIFGGGGGVILPEEIAALESYGITKIYSPDDGRRLGLQGMINDLVKRCDYSLNELPEINFDKVDPYSDRKIARLITIAENDSTSYDEYRQTLTAEAGTSPAKVLGVTGTGGAGKSSFVDEIIRRFTEDFPDKKIGIISVDPTKRKTGGALLGDRIRMNSVHHPSVFMRSMATRGSNLSLSRHIPDAIDILKAAGLDLIILESSGIGQSDSEIHDVSDLSLYIMTPEFGAGSQLEKIDMLDFADIVVINKADKRGAEDALRDVRKQYQRNQQLWDTLPEDIDVYLTKASRFNDPGIQHVYEAILSHLDEKGCPFINERLQGKIPAPVEEVTIPGARIRYLSEIADLLRHHEAKTDKQCALVQEIYGIVLSIAGLIGENDPFSLVSPTGLDKSIRSNKKGFQSEKSWELIVGLCEWFDAKYEEVDKELWELICAWPTQKKELEAPLFTYQVRGNDIGVKTTYKSLSHTSVPKISLPKYSGWGDLLQWIIKENQPGLFPFTAGIYPFKRVEEETTRMFAGEGGPERTNRRFHYLSRDVQAVRLSTAFDSVTLYGQDPARRPDIYGKIGNAGVSVASLDDAKRLYSGFDLCEKSTSVSMTINGPAPIMLSFFLNAAIDQQCELHVRKEGKVKEASKKIDDYYKNLHLPRPVYRGEMPAENKGLGLILLGAPGNVVLDAEIYERIKTDTLKTIRGTVQADILKEDQAQNTCIFSTDFALKMMGDVQEYFIEHEMTNFYSVSISGYHIAEAGANPITQLAFTLANGFTYVEYYLSRGMHIDQFGPNLSFFFSNGLDPEYAVIGRVARRIWARAMRYKYGASSRAQKLKYHIQTSGRSLHAQEIAFNDIRTTLQALYAIYDNCNSLHTNAYDEAITTPTEESVRRALAIQLIINKEFGLAKTENSNQGSFIIEELTDLVEEAVLYEFDRLTERGGVLGAMETMYQRSKIQEESMYYEELKHTGEYPLVGVNTFLDRHGSPTILPKKVFRSSSEEKELQIEGAELQRKAFPAEQDLWLNRLKESSTQGQNTFSYLMEASKYASMGQITQTLFDVGGRYRRNM